MKPSTKPTMKKNMTKKSQQATKSHKKTSTLPQSHHKRSLSTSTLSPQQFPLAQRNALKTKKIVAQQQPYQYNVLSLASSLFPTTSLNFTNFTPSSSFHSTSPSFAMGGGRSKGAAPVKKFDTPVKAPKKELSQDEKDKKKLDKLEREKAKQATRQAQISRSSDRAKAEAELANKKLQQIQLAFQKAHLNIQAVDEKEKAELEANEKRNKLEEEAAAAARALRRATGDV